MTFEEFKGLCLVEMNENGPKTEVTCTFVDSLIRTFESSTARKVPEYIENATILDLYNYFKKEFGS